MAVRAIRSVTTSRIARESFVIVVCLGLDLAAWGGDRELSMGGRAPAWLIPMLAVPAMSTVLLRGTRPVSVLLFQVVYSCITILVPAYQPITGLLIACYGVAARRPGRVSLAALASVVAPIGVQTYVTASTYRQTAGDAMAGAALSVALVATAMVLGRFAHAASQRAAQAEEESAARAVEALRNERLRLARELHDIVAHSVSIMLLQAAGARRLAASWDSALVQPLAVIEDVGVQAMNELNRMLNVLRAADSGEDTRERPPGLEDLSRLLELSRLSGLEVVHEVEGTPRRLDASVNLAGYRVVQEALTNATKHAGPSARVAVRLRWSPDGLIVNVVSSPASHRPDVTAHQVSGGFGLRGLRERVEVIGGSFSAEPSPDGFQIRARLPMGSEHPEEIMRGSAE